MEGIITDKITIAENTLMIQFNLLGEDLSFKPGQYSFVTLINPPFEDERGKRRHFSITTSPNDRRNIAVATRLGPSAFKRSLIELPVGSSVELGPVGGNFTLPADTVKPLVFIAGGIGITPFMSMLRFANDIGFPYNITLFYANTTSKSAAFFDELANLSKAHSRFKFIPIMTQDKSWEGETRHIDGSLLKTYLDDITQPSYYIAGPQAMVKTLFTKLAEAYIPEDNITTESFSGY